MHCVSAIVSCRIRNLHRNPCDRAFDDIIDRWSGRDGEAGSPTSVRADKVFAETIAMRGYASPPNLVEI